MPTDFDEGLLTGLLVGEGHFGGDGRQPHVTLRMHERHERLFRWIERTFPGGRLYGPYEHSGRRYYQWMARGGYLRDVLLPVLERRMDPHLDRYAFERFDAMRTRYGRQLSRAAAGGPDETGARAGGGGEAPGTAGPEDAAAGGAVAPAGAAAAERIFATLRELDEPT